MGLFSATKPVITLREKELIRNRLYSEHGFNQKKLAIVDHILEPHIKNAERYGEVKGISSDEVKQIDEQLDRGDLQRLYSADLTEPEKDAVKKLLDDYLKLNK